MTTNPTAKIDPMQLIGFVVSPTGVIVAGSTKDTFDSILQACSAVTVHPAVGFKLENRGLLPDACARAWLGLCIVNAKYWEAFTTQLLESPPNSYAYEYGTGRLCDFVVVERPVSSSLVSAYCNTLPGPGC
jgi:hypothetical protein